MSHLHTYADIVIRTARPQDKAALSRLAQLDSKHLPNGELLVAEEGGQLRAAVSLTGDDSIADPFHPTSDAVALLELRAARERPRNAPSLRRLRRRQPRTRRTRTASPRLA